MEITGHFIGKYTGGVIYDQIIANNVLFYGQWCAAILRKGIEVFSVATLVMRFFFQVEAAISSGQNDSELLSLQQEMKELIALTEDSLLAYEKSSMLSHLNKTENVRLSVFNLACP